MTDNIIKNTLTTCPYCGCGCGLYISVKDNKPVGTFPAANHIVSKGKLCPKGWHSHEIIDHPDRLKTPLIKENGSFRKASWEEALTVAANKFLEIKNNYGSNALACIASARCTNEENYLVQKLARAVFGTNSVDHCART